MHNTRLTSPLDRLHPAGLYADQSVPDLVIPEDLSTLSDEELHALHDQAVEAFNAVYGDGSALTEEEFTALTSLTEGVETLRTEIEARDSVANERTEQANELAARINPVEETDEGGESTDAQDSDNEGEDDAESGAEEGAQADATDEPELDADGNPVVAAEVVEQPEAVAAAAAAPRQPIRVNLSGLRSRQAPPASRTSEPGAPTTMRDLVTAAPDMPGYANGEGLNWDDIGQAVDRRLRGFNDSQYAAAAKAGREMRQQFGVAVIRKPIEEGLQIQSNDPAHVDEVVTRARNENRLKGGSLVAAGGWCAPSQTLYDNLLEMESRDGLIAIPEIGITRGGINFTRGPDFADIFADTGWTYSEANDIAGEYGVDANGVGNGTAGSKPCYEVECPDFEEVRLGLMGLCISSGLLKQRGYPEVIARTVRGALVAHDHRMSAAVIQEMVTGSEAVTMLAGQVGATAPILTAIEQQTEHYRYVHRLTRNTTVEIVAPYWVRGVIRSDLSRRLGVDMMSVTDAQIAAWFTARNAVPQYVYNWQDITGDASAFTAWPETVKFLMYAAGTWVKGRSDILTLDTIYDSVNLGTNDYTALFTEEGYLVAKMGHDSRVIEVSICGDGATHAGVDIACDGTAVPAA